MMNRYTQFLAILFLFISITSCQDDDEDDNSPSSSNGSASVGALAGEYLSDQQYSSLRIEILFEARARPTNQAITNLEDFLEDYLKKPQGISTVWTEIPAQEEATYTLSELREIESNYRTVFNNSNQISAYFFFANGNYSEDTENSNTLGIAYSSSSMVIFEKTIQDNSGGIGEASATNVEEAVSKHEFGHILGLVNLGTPMVNNHQDETHGKHCTNADCLMYYATETGALFGNILGGGVPQLGSNCQADLSANGGK
jgi:hypothetical protein